MNTMKKKRSFAGRLCRLLLIKIPVGVVVLSLLWVLALKWVPVWVTPLMIQRTVENWNDKTFKTHKTWVSYDRISPELAKAVIASEDNLFDSHNGFDWKSINKAINDHEKRGKRLRGASTISQQTAKNVFLLPSRSYVRKGLEAYFTVLIEFMWGKERIMEVYLNSIEMGPGIYGVDAVAQYHFETDAAHLTRSDCALIAATLPNPIRFSSLHPNAYMRQRQSWIEHQMRAIPPFPGE